MRAEENVIASSGTPPFFRVANTEDMILGDPPTRRGEALRTYVRSLSGFQKEAFVNSARTGLTWRLVSDEGKYLNGHDAAPCPLAFLSSGMAASYMNEILALAEERGHKLQNLRLILDNYYSMKGSMAKRTMTGGAERPELTVEVSCDLSDTALNEFLMDAAHSAPISGLLRGRHDSLFKLSKNGREIPTGRALEIDGKILEDPWSQCEKATPTVSNLQLMAPAGTTPKKFVNLGTSTGGSSLTDEQNRRLNIGAIATLNEHGVKEIRQMQYSPHGTSFRFLSSEDGRAPDASTLISAGIGLCFMTQFGRFASMLKLDLPRYSILQDTHFSLGGTSGEAGFRGVATPVETHVFLETSESDGMAQEMLDVSEQTCFLHAFCRTDLKIRLKVVRT